MQNLNIIKMRKTLRDTATKRREENKTFCKNHLKTLSEEQNISEVNVDLSYPNCADGYFEIIDNEYKLYNFSEVSFGKDSATDDGDLINISNVCFYYCSFNMCGFNNILFENCSFVGCDFIECYTLGIAAIFKNCSFISRSQNKKSIEDMPSLFDSCEFTIRLINCDVSSIVFNKTHFYFSSFVEVKMSDSIFVDCSFDTTTICSCDLRGTKLLNPKFIEFYIEDLDKKTKVNRKTFLDYVCYNKKESREVKDAVEAYYAFSELFENSKIMDFSGEYFFLAQKTGLPNLKGFAKFKSILSFITCGYGERPFFSLLASLTLVFLCGTLYMFFGVNINNEVISFHPSLSQPLPPLEQLVLWYHFSLVTFSTVGYGNVVPVGGSLIVSAVEMVLGVVMVGIWVSTLVRKMTRN